MEVQNGLPRRFVILMLALPPSLCLRELVVTHQHFGRLVLNRFDPQFAFEQTANGANPCGGGGDVNIIHIFEHVFAWQQLRFDCLQCQMLPQGEKKWHFCVTLHHFRFGECRALRFHRSSTSTLMPVLQTNGNLRSIKHPVHTTEHRCAGHQIKSPQRVLWCADQLHTLIAMHVPRIRKRGRTEKVQWRLSLVLTTDKLWCVPQDALSQPLRRCF